MLASHISFLSRRKVPVEPSHLAVVLDEHFGTGLEELAVLVALLSAEAIVHDAEILPEHERDELHHGGGDDEQAAEEDERVHVDQCDQS